MVQTKCNQPQPQTFTFNPADNVFDKNNQGQDDWSGLKYNKNNL